MVPETTIKYYFQKNIRSSEQTKKKKKKKEGKKERERREEKRKEKSRINIYDEVTSGGMGEGAKQFGSANR